MKIINKTILIGTFLISSVYCVGEAGAIFLLINPGSGAAGVGEAQVAKADDAYASYYNPAGLAFLDDKQVALQHVNWLPNLADDIFYEFLSYSHHVPNIGTFGGHLIFLNLGEQTATDEFGTTLGKFKSYMTAFTTSYGMKLNEHASFGVNFKIFHQKLAESAYGQTGVAAEVGDPYSTDFAFDIGYLKKFGKEYQHRFGISIQNIGPPIDFVDAEQSDPAPTNMRLGLYTRLFKSPKNSLHFLFDANKLLVAAYPEMDWNGDGIISGSKEEVHTDPWHKALITAWLDDWHYGGDLNKCEGDCNDVGWSKEIGYNSGTTNLDNRIGGYTIHDFAWNKTEGTVGEYIGEIYVPNYEYFCTQDQANCYTAAHELITESNYDQNTIAYIDLPHDNLGLAPIEEYNNPVFVPTDIMDNGTVLFQSGCYTDDPVNDGGTYINDFDASQCTGNFYDISQGINVDDYDFQYLSTGDIQIAISDGNFDNVNILNCNAVSLNDEPWDGTGIWNDANFANNASAEPCNNDLEYDTYGEHGFDDDEYGIYNVFGNEEKGTGEQRKFTDEFKEMIYNFGFEWWYTEHFAMRLGYIYDEEGKIKNPTFGAGIRFNKYGFDFGYTSGDKDHPRANTMFYSLTLGL